MNSATLFLTPTALFTRLNPIEQAWPILKKKVTDLLREIQIFLNVWSAFLKLIDYKKDRFKIIKKYNSKIEIFRANSMKS